MLDELGEAFDRIDDFLAVQHLGRLDTSRDEMIDALHCLQESVGIGDGERSLFAERLEAIAEVAGPGGTATTVAVGGVLLGLVVGLIAEQLRAERRERE